MSLAKRLLSVQPSGGGGSFNPETDITWHSLFWTEGTEFIARGYTNGSTVGTWDNEGDDANVTGGTGILATSNALFGSRPTVNHGASSSGMQTFSVAPSAVCTVVGILRHAVISGEIWMSANPKVEGGERNGSWNLWAGAWGASGGTSDMDPHMRVWYLNGSSSKVDVDGANIVTGNAGHHNITGSMDWGRKACEVSLWGIYNGDITADPAYADFKTWVDDHYGITIA